MKRILFVSGFGQSTRAKDLAYEFERFGPLVRCDIPVPRGNPNATPYAFIEFRSTRDAEAAHRDMHERKIDGYRIGVQWAKNPPSAIWRDSRNGMPSSGRPRRRSRSPRRDRPDERRRRSRSRSRDRDRDRRRSRSRSPRRDDHRDRDRPRESRRDRSPTPEKRRDKDREHDRARTPPLKEEIRPENGDHDRAHTPPYEA